MWRHRRRVDRPGDSTSNDDFPRLRHEHSIPVKGVLLMLAVVSGEYLRHPGRVGWGRGLAMAVLCWPPQSLLGYSGFILVPLRHPSSIQCACAEPPRLVLASLVLPEKPPFQRIIGG